MKVDAMTGLRAAIIAMTSLFYACGGAHHTADASSDAIGSDSGPGICHCPPEVGEVAIPEDLAGSVVSASGDSCKIIDEAPAPFVIANATTAGVCHIRIALSDGR